MMKSEAPQQKTYFFLFFLSMDIFQLRFSCDIFGYTVDGVRHVDNFFRKYKQINVIEWCDSFRSMEFGN